MKFCPNCGAAVPKLNRRLIEVLELIAEGCSRKEIARQLGLSEFTVRTYMHQLIVRLGVPRDRDPRISLAVWWNSPLFQEGLRALEMLPKGTS